MLNFAFISLLLGLQAANGNPNHYFDDSIDIIKEELDTQISKTFFHTLILQVHVNVNAKYVTNVIDEEIERIIKKDSNCQSVIAGLKNNILQNCRMEKSFEALSGVSEKFEQLKEVACLTAEVCEELNPMAGQTDDVERCELAKIADLRHQITIVEKEFEESKNILFDEHDRCVRELLEEMYGSLAVILRDCRS